MNCRDIKFVKNGLSNYMKNKGFSESFIIDSNIIITLRDLFYNPIKKSDEEIDGLLGFINCLKDKDVIVSAALQEVSWDCENLKTDEVKFNRCNEAIMELLLNPEVIERIRRKEVYTGTHAPVKGQKRKLNSIYENSIENNYIVPTMCVFIKLQELLLRYDVEKDSEHIYNEIVKFMADKVGLVGSYELILIQVILFSYDNDIIKEIKGLLKLDNKNNFKKDFKKSLWNASWDISFMRSINAMAVNSLRGEAVNGVHNPTLVTGDDNLYKLTTYFIENMEFRGFNGRMYPVIKAAAVNEKYLNNIIASKMVIDATLPNRLAKHNSVSQEQRMEEFKLIIRETEYQITKIINK